MLHLKDTSFQIALANKEALLQIAKQMKTLEIPLDIN